MEFLTESGVDGYHRAQVDAYVGELRQAYSHMYEAYTALQRRNEEVQAHCNRLQAELAAYHAVRDAIVRVMEHMPPVGSV